MKKKLKTAKASAALKPKASNLSTIIIGFVVLIGVMLSVGLLVSAAGGPENPEKFLAARLTTGTEQTTITITGDNEDRLNQVSGVKYYALQYPSAMSEFDVFCSKEAADYAGTAIAPATPAVLQETIKGATSYFTHYSVGLPIPSQLIRQAVTRGLSTEIEKKTGLCIMIVLSDDEEDFKDNVRQISSPRINLITTAGNVLTIGGLANSSGINHDATAWRVLTGGYSDSCLAEDGASAFPNKGTTIALTPDNDGTWICIRIEDYRGNTSVQKMELIYSGTRNMWDTACAYRGGSSVGLSPIPEEGFCTEDDTRNPINSPAATVIRNMWDTACAYRGGSSVGIGPLSEEDFCTEDDTRNPINSPAVLPDNSEQDESGNANQSPTIQQTTTVPEEESFIFPPPIPSDAIGNN